MNSLNRVLLAAIVAMLLLSACGQTGALYLPETETAEVEGEEESTKEE